MQGHPAVTQKYLEIARVAGCPQSLSAQDIFQKMVKNTDQSGLLHVCKYYVATAGELETATRL